MDVENHPMSKFAGVWDVVGEISRIHDAVELSGPKIVGIGI